jgi:signal recognition particle GTPase
MHTKDNLLKEMEKICRVTKPNLKVFVAEAIAALVSWVGISKYLLLEQVTRHSNSLVVTIELSVE